MPSPTSTMEGATTYDNAETFENLHPDHTSSRKTLPPGTTISSQPIHQYTDTPPASNTPKVQPHKESNVKMSTNRDQAVQIAIGNSLVDLLKHAAFILATLAVIMAIAAVFTKLVARLFSGHGGIMVAIMVILVIIMAPLVFGTDASLVRAQSIHYVLMVCGSGGHTAEMIQMVERSICPEKLSHRRWAIGKDDEKSYEKVLAFEHRLLSRFSCQGLDSGTFDVVRFRRARYVHQSWLTTPFTAILSLLDILLILVTPPGQHSTPKSHYPGVIVTNGPGTGFLFLVVAQALKLVHIPPRSHMRTIYVESWARVKSLSLTGKLVQRMKLADTFIVQSRYLVTSTSTLSENLLVMPAKPKVPLDT